MQRRRPSEESDPVNVLDDFGGDFPIGAAELDAVEAFLLPLIEELLADDNPEHPPTDSEVPQKPALV